MPRKQKVVYTVAILDEQVNNGGFNQYFTNGYGQFAVETIDCLKSIRAFKIMAFLEKAYVKINKDGLENSIFRKKLIEGNINELYESDSLDDYLGKLDNEYYKYEDDLGALLGNFLRDK